jgi:glycosyltransferase involved in cell wall biosynthesis
MKPLLSVCIPTFNRADSLNNLFKSLVEIKKNFPKKIQICVSDNHSTDNTGSVIKMWSECLGLNILTQLSNIGGTRNVVEITKLASGKWHIIVGDDDALILDGVKKLMEYLETANEDEWILAGVADHTGAEHLLGNLNDGCFEARQMQAKILKTGIYRYGFIGMHVFPGKFSRLLQSILLNDIKPWPHLAIFLRHISFGSTKIIKTPIVAQAAEGYRLYWEPRDWVLINLKKIDIIHGAAVAMNKKILFYNSLILRELYSLKGLKSLVLWKVLQENFDWREANTEYKCRYLFAGSLSFLCIFHYFIILSIAITPQNFLILFFRICGFHHVLVRHRAVKNKFGVFDGIKRGI